MVPGEPGTGREAPNAARHIPGSFVDQLLASADRKGAGTRRRACWGDFGSPAQRRDGVWPNFRGADDLTMRPQVGGC